MKAIKASVEELIEHLFSCSRSEACVKDWILDSFKSKRISKETNVPNKVVLANHSKSSSSAEANLSPL